MSDINKEDTIEEELEESVAAVNKNRREVAADWIAKKAGRPVELAKEEVQETARVTREVLQQNATTYTNRLKNWGKAVIDLPVGVTKTGLRSSLDLITAQPLKATGRLTKGLKRAIADNTIKITAIPTLAAGSAARNTFNASGNALSKFGKISKKVAKLPVTAPLAACSTVYNGMKEMPAKFTRWNESGVQQKVEGGSSNAASAAPASDTSSAPLQSSEPTAEAPSPADMSPAPTVANDNEGDAPAPEMPAPVEIPEAANDTRAANDTQRLAS